MVGCAHAGVLQSFLDLSLLLSPSLFCLDFFLGCLSLPPILRTWLWHFWLLALTLCQNQLELFLVFRFLYASNFSTIRFYQLFSLPRFATFLLTFVSSLYLVVSRFSDGHLILQLLFFPPSELPEVAAGPSWCRPYFSRSPSGLWAWNGGISTTGDWRWSFVPAWLQRSYVPLKCSQWTHFAGWATFRFGFKDSLQWKFVFVFLTWSSSIFLKMEDIDK